MTPPTAQQGKDDETAEKPNRRLGYVFELNGCVDPEITSACVPFRKEQVKAVVLGNHQAERIKGNICPVQFWAFSTTLGVSCIRNRTSDAPVKPDLNTNEYETRTRTHS